MYEIAKTLGKLRSDLVKQGFSRDKAEDIAGQYLGIYMTDLSANGESLELTTPHEVVYGKGEAMSIEQAKKYLSWT